MLPTHTQSSPIQFPNLKTVSHRLFMNCGHICVVTPTRGNVGGTQFPIQFWRAALKLLNQGTVHGHGLSMAMDCPWPWTVHGHGVIDCRGGRGARGHRLSSLKSMDKGAPAHKRRRRASTQKKKARRLLYKLTAPFTIQAYHTVYYTSLPHRLLYKLTAPILYKLTAPTLYKLTTPTLYGVPGVPGTLGSLGPGAQKAHRLLYKLTAPILYKLTAPILYKLTAPMTKHEYRANIMGVPPRRLLT